MKDENPFRAWLERDVYGGYWVPVAQLGGWLGPASCPALVRGPRSDVLADSDWPLQFADAGPQVWESCDKGEKHRQAVLHPVEERDGLTFTPFVVHFDPFRQPGWLEPVQAFVLHFGAWPDHLGNGNVTWYEEGDDSKPEEIARWRLVKFEDNETTYGVLEIRRDRLMTFLSTFDFDLAIYFEENILANELAEDWTDDGGDEQRGWHCWSAEVFDEVRAVLRVVTYLERPAYEEPRRVSQRERLPFVVGTDSKGAVVTATNPPTAFLTPVYFGEAVLERYYEDTRTYKVEKSLVRGGRQWILPIARTGRGTIHAWLGDLNNLPPSVQRHWQAHAVPDDGGVPEWRLRQDFLAQWVTVPDEGPIADLRRAIAAANGAAIARFGEPLFAEIEEVHAEAIEVLRVPANPSMPAFLEQVRTLAILVVDHLNSRFLEAAVAPADNSGVLNRLAGLIASITGDDLAGAKDRIGGLYAVQAVRSNVASHRTGANSDRTLQRAGIQTFDLPEGFRKLIAGAVQAITQLAELFGPEGACSATTGE